MSSLSFRLRLHSIRLAASLILWCCLPQLLSAQSASWTAYSLPNLQQTMLRSAAGAKYRVVVALPSGPAPARGYPVIYVVDGNAWTALVSEIVRVNLGFGIQSRVEPAVVVGIGYPVKSAVDLKRRKLDFTSAVPAEDRDHAIGDGPIGGDLALMDFIDKVAKPVIETRFKVNQHRQTLLGHSLGGLFTLSTMLDRPQSFQTYVALSPSIWWNRDALLEKAEHALARPGALHAVRVFLSVGELEQYMTPDYIQHSHVVARSNSTNDAEADADSDADMNEMRAKTMVGNVRRMAALLNAARVQTKCVEFPDEDHFSVIPAALGRAVHFALSDGLHAHASR